MTGHYALDVHYGDDDEVAVRVPLPDCSAEDAETERQALVSRVEHGRQLNVPEINARDTAPGDDIALDPARVSSVDLVEVDDQS